MARISLCLAALLLLATGSRLEAQALDEMSLDRWAKLREVERFQLNVAEKHWRESHASPPCDDAV